MTDDNKVFCWLVWSSSKLCFYTKKSRRIFRPKKEVSLISFACNTFLGKAFTIISFPVIDIDR